MYNNRMNQRKERKTNKPKPFNAENFNITNNS